MNRKSIWIQAPGAVEPHQFSLFRKKFLLTSGGEVRIRVSADTDFVATLDGGEILRGQFSDYPDQKTYTECVLTLAEGEHVLLVDLYYCGIDLYTYVPGPPGIWVEIAAGAEIWGSDLTWEAKINRGYLRDRLDLVTNQVGFTVGMDARKMDRTTGFGRAVPSIRREIPQARPLPPLLDLPSVKGQLVKRGYLTRRGKLDGPYAAVVDRDRYERKPGKRSNGYFFIYDLGVEYAGFIELELELPAGTVVDVSHGEHLADGRVRNRIWIRNFTDRYICSGVPSHATMPRRIGGRFIQLNVVLRKMARIKTPRVALRPREVALPPAASAPAGCDAFAKLLLKCAERTLRLCMHEHYEDTPWREQALYAYDSRNQMLFGYYLWGNYDFAAVSLKLLGDGIREDGYLPLTAPTRLGPPIACFSLVWVAALAEHAAFSGSRRAFEQNRTAVGRIVDRVLTGYKEDTGLYWTPAIKGVWHFYEWSPGLDGTEPGCELGEGSEIPRLEAPYNLHVLEMFDALAGLTGEMRWQSRADALRTAIFNAFWDENSQALCTRQTEPDRLHELVQALGLYTGVLTGESRRLVIEGIIAERFIPMSLSSLLYLFRALRGESGAVPAYLERRIHCEFEPMLTPESSTLWETRLGAADFFGAGSMCHGWSALPVYYYFTHSAASAEDGS